MDTSFYIKRSPILCGVFGVVKGRFHTANECRKPYQTLEHQGEPSGVRFSRKTHFPLHLDWPLYPIPRGAFGNGDLTCMAFRRVGIYIRWLGSQDYTLGTLVSLHLYLGSMLLLLTVLLALRMRTGRFTTPGVKPRFA